MISGVVPFYSIIESVKDETGIQNLRPYYDKIRRLIFRGERKIGYGGSVKLKKKSYDTSNGKYFKYPEDFIEIEGIGSCCEEIPKNEIQLKEEGFCLRKKREKVVLLYWGLSVDEEGFPIVTRNHEEAIIAYIVWKLYSARVFLGLGNFNLKKDYEQAFNSEVGEARGNDAFPTIEEYAEASEINSMDRRLLFKFNPLRYNFCDECLDDDCDEEEPVQDPSIYHWQEEGPDRTINSIIMDYNTSKETYFSSKENNSVEEFNNGLDLTYSSIGRIAFGIVTTDTPNWKIFDILNNDVTHVFDTYHDLTTNVLFFVSKMMYPHITMNLKIIKQ